MSDSYERIRAALAMGPTPGPWQLSLETPTIIKQDLSSIGLSRGGVLIGSACGHESSGLYPTYEQAIANARLIAACDPDTIRALIEERDALEAENKRLQAEVDALRTRLEDTVRDSTNEIEAQRAEVDALRDALEEIRSRSTMNLAMRPNPFALTARLGDIYQIADAMLAEQEKK